MNTLTNVDQLKNQIANLFLQVEAKQHEIAIFEYTCDEEQFNDFLDDCYDEVEVMGMTYNVSYALKELDPIAYRCGKSEYEADFDLENCEEYRDMLTELNELESQLDDLQTEIDDLESED